MSEFVRLWSDQKKMTVGSRGACAPVPHSWRHQCTCPQGLFKGQSEVLVLVLEVKSLIMSLHLHSAYRRHQHQSSECFPSLASLWGHTVWKRVTIWWVTLGGDMHCDKRLLHCSCIVIVQLAGSSLSDLRPADTGRRCKVKTRVTLVSCCVYCTYMHHNRSDYWSNCNIPTVAACRPTDTSVLVLVIQVLVNISDKIWRRPQNVSPWAIFSQ